MNKREILLAALAPAAGKSHSPVQIQKLLFLIDRELVGIVGGPVYDFRPYNYGPFDATIYTELTGLAEQGLVQIGFENSWRSYALTENGQREGDKLLGALAPKAQEFIKNASLFVRSLSFAQLVSAIYSAYPDMKVNSVFQGCE